MKNTTFSPGTLPTTGQVADRLAITEVLYLHSRGLDRLDPHSIAAAYWPEAKVDYGSFKGSAHVFADLVVGALQAQYELTRHSLSNTLIELREEHAVSESCVHAGHLLPGGLEELLFYGRYLDKLQRRDGQWKLLHRQVVMDWSKRLTVTDERNSEAFAALAKGAHLNKDDPLYPFLQSKP